MASTHEEMIQGASGERDWRGWKTINMITIQDGCTGSSFVAKVNNAITLAGYTIGGNFGALAPYCYLQSVHASIIDGSPNTVRLELKFERDFPERFKPGTMELGASLISVETNKDKDDNVMWLSHTYPIGYRRSPQDDPLTVAVESGQITHTTNKFIPEKTRTFTKQVSEADAKTASDYTGCINSVDWLDSGDANKWMAVHIHGRSEDGGNSYNMTYNFIYRKETWLHEAIFIQDNGKPPYPFSPAATLGSDGDYKEYPIYEEKAFANLGLT